MNEEFGSDKRDAVRMELWHLPQQVRSEGGVGGDGRPDESIAGRGADSVVSSIRRWLKLATAERPGRSRPAASHPAVAGGSSFARSAGGRGSNGGSISVRV